MSIDLPKLTQPQIQRNLEDKARSLTVRDMYNQQSIQTNLWGVDGYSPPKYYHDANKMAKDKELWDLYKKPYNLRPKAPRATKKGHFIDDMKKQDNPPQVGPGAYKIEQEWVTEKMKEQGKRAPKNTNKNSFIDQIFNEQKLRHIPGVGKYNVTKTFEEIKKDIEEMEGNKISHYDDFKYVSNTVPGPGQYNPHSVEKGEIVKIKVNGTKPDQWIKKHKDEQLKYAKSDRPDVGTYRNNHPVDFATFGKLLIESKEGSHTKGTKSWGSDERFHDPKKNKSNMVLNVPGPGQYQLIAKWQGKDVKKDALKDKNWMDSLSRGVSKSIYY